MQRPRHARRFQSTAIAKAKARDQDRDDEVDQGL
jgi:hypothetical protein